MQVAGKILVLGGLVNLAIAFAYGFMMASRRSASPETPQPLLLQAHRAALWEGFMLLGLIWAVYFSDIGKGLEILAAALIITGSFLAGASNYLNWRHNVADQFAARSQGFRAAAASTVPSSIGLLILIIGVLKGL